MLQVVDMCETCTCSVVYIYVAIVRLLRTMSLIGSVVLAIVRRSCKSPLSPSRYRRSPRWRGGTVVGQAYRHRGNGKTAPCCSIARQQRLRLTLHCDILQQASWLSPSQLPHFSPLVVLLTCSRRTPDTEELKLPPVQGYSTTWWKRPSQTASLCSFSRGIYSALRLRNNNCPCATLYAVCISEKPAHVLLRVQVREVHLSIPLP